MAIDPLLMFFELVRILLLRNNMQLPNAKLFDAVFYVIACRNINYVLEKS
jgi:hypothetical protein